MVKKKTKTMYLRLTPKDHEELKKAAEEMGVSMQRLAEQAIKDVLIGIRVWGRKWAEVADVPEGDSDDTQ